VPTVSDALIILRRQLHRQIAHWEMAATELSNLEQTASPQAWSSLERYVGVSLRKSLEMAIDQLRREARVVRALFEAARTMEGLDRVSRELVSIRDRYLKTETLIDYYGHAVNTRTNPALATNLRAFDVLAMRSINQLLEPMGKPTPPVLTYLDKGLGASILKAGLRLWDGSISTVATIKVTFHNRRRPTALIHETGHQVAHILDWNEELADVLQTGLRNVSTSVATTWSSWASEVAADCFGFVHTGFASVAALADVVGGEPGVVFRHLPGDPHPISYARVLFGVEMCRRFYGRGPWDDLGSAWIERYSLDLASPAVRELLVKSRASLTQIVELCLLRRMRSFGNRALADLINPDRVSLKSLELLEAGAGQALFTSPKWIWNECVRLIGLTGLRFATRPEDSQSIAMLQDQLMERLGNSVASIYTAASA
jgi:hypothetical protein